MYKGSDKWKSTYNISSHVSRKVILLKIMSQGKEFEISNLLLEKCYACFGRGEDEEEKEKEINYRVNNDMITQLLPFMNQFWEQLSFAEKYGIILAHKEEE